MVALGRIPMGDHQGSWAFIAEFTATRPADLVPEEVALLDQKCLVYGSVVVAYGGGMRPWLPSRELRLPVPRQFTEEEA